MSKSPLQIFDVLAIIVANGLRVIGVCFSGFLLDLFISRGAKDDMIQDNHTWGDKPALRLTHAAVDQVA